MPDDRDDAGQGADPAVGRGSGGVAAALDDVQRTAAETLEDLRRLLDAVDPPAAGPSDTLSALGVRPEVARGGRDRPTSSSDPTSDTPGGGPRVIGGLPAAGDRPCLVRGLPAADVALALGTAAIVLVDVTVLPVRRPVVSAILGVGSTALPLMLRRRAPLVVAGAAGAGLVGGSLLGDLPAGPVAPYFILTIVPFAAGSHAPTVGRALAAVAITTGSAIVAVAPQARGVRGGDRNDLDAGDGRTGAGRGTIAGTGDGWPRPRDLTALAGYGALVGALTWFARHHRVRALALALDADELRRRHPDLVRAVREEERARVARDLHDAVSHGVTVCAVLAGGAAASVRGGTPVSAADLRPLRRAVGGVHRELETLVRALGLPEDRVAEGGGSEGRTTEGGVVGVAPDGEASDGGRGFDASRPLGILVPLVRGAGTGIPLRIEVEPGARIPPAIADAVYRIVQEALTNAARHAGGPVTGVLVRAAGRVLEVEVLSGPAGRPPANAPSGSGRGLPGMRRRAAELGGRVDAGPLPGGGFRVAARLPLTD